MKEKNFYQNLKPMNESKYLNIDNDRLVIYTVDQLEQNNIEPTFDKVVVTVFKLFPKRFSLIGFPEYPDGKRVHDCLWHCTYKTKQWLFGNPKTGYRLTQKGKIILEDTIKRLQDLVKPSKKYSMQAKRKEVYFIEKLKKTKAFKKFQNNQLNQITNFEVREALLGTETTSIQTLQKNSDQLIEYAHSINDKDVETFLEFLNTRLAKGGKYARKY